MEILNQDLIQEIVRLTWRNPAFMAIAIAFIWLVPQIIIRKIMFKNYEKKKIKWTKSESFIPKLSNKMYKFKEKKLRLRKILEFLWNIK